jgi:putative sigma-54 modulation protein
MNIIIQSPHFKSRPELDSFVNIKVSHLKQFDEDIISADVCLKLDKSSDSSNKLCEIKLHLPGHELFAKKQSKTFEEATNQAIDALQQQLHKLKN